MIVKPLPENQHKVAEWFVSTKLNQVLDFVRVFWKKKRKVFFCARRDNFKWGWGLHSNYWGQAIDTTTCVYTLIRCLNKIYVPAISRAPWWRGGNISTLLRVCNWLVYNTVSFKVVQFSAFCFCKDVNIPPTAFPKLRKHAVISHIIFPCNNQWLRLLWILSDQ